MRLRAYLNIFLAAFFWGSSATAAKFLFEHDISPLLVVESRVIIATIILFLFFLVVNPKSLRIRLSDLLDFGLLGIVGVAGANYTYYMAIRETTVGIAILMQYTAPVLVAVYMMVTRKEKISSTKIFAIILSLSGCFVMLGLFNSDVRITALGIILGASSAVCFAFFNIYNRIASKDYSTWTAINYTLLCASAFWFVFDLVWKPAIPFPHANELLSLTVFSFTSVLIPYYFYFIGLKHISPSTAVIVSTLEPVTAIFTAFVFLGETLHFAQVMGGALVIGAVVLLELRRE